MPITINGTGNITGLTSGAGIAATSLSGQVPDANAPSGSVIQVVNGTVGYVTTLSTSYVDTGLTASITPSFTTSKILVNINLVGVTAASTGWGFALTNSDNTIIQNLQNYNSLNNQTTGYSYSFLLSPATTSLLTYKIRYYASAGGATRLTDYASNLQLSTITLMEIAA